MTHIVILYAHSAMMWLRVTRLINVCDPIHLYVWHVYSHVGGE